MSQAPRQSRGLHPIRAAARRWRAEIRRAHTGPGRTGSWSPSVLRSWRADLRVGRSAISCMRRYSCRKGRGQAGARLLRQFDRRSGVI